MDSYGHSADGRRSCCSQLASCKWAHLIDGHNYCKETPTQLEDASVNKIEPIPIKVSDPTLVSIGRTIRNQCTRLVEPMV